MAKKMISLPSMSRVTPGSTAILDLPIGPTYEQLIFSASGTGLAATHFGGIRLLIDGTVRRTHKDLQRLMDLNGYYNQSVDSATEFMVHFIRQEFASLADELTPGLGTQDLRTLTIEIDILAGAPANIAMSAAAFVDTEPQPLGVYTQIKEYTLPVSAAGDVDWDKLSRANANVYQAVHFFKSDVTKVYFEVDSFKVADFTKAQLERIQRSARPIARVPVTAKASTLDFNIRGAVSDLLNMRNVKDSRFRLTVGSAGTIEIVTEELTMEK
ncbi:MAG TPA: major capsid protein P2 [Flavisolibacter sp.]